MNHRRFKLFLVLVATSTVVVLAGCAQTGVGDPCEPEVEFEGSLGEAETVIETSSLQCRTRVCMYYNGHSFCTERCNSHGDCLADWFERGPEAEGEDSDWPPAWCEAEVTVGSPGIIGHYCVPDRASAGEDARD